MSLRQNAVGVSIMSLVDLPLACLLGIASALTAKANTIPRYTWVFISLS